MECENGERVELAVIEEKVECWRRREWSVRVGKDGACGLSERVDCVGRASECSVRVGRE